MSSQFRRMLTVQHEREIIQRQNSHGSSQQSEYESAVSDNGMSSHSGGSSGKTPSEYSLPTPEDEHFQPEIDQFYFGMDTNTTDYPMANTRIKRLSDDSTVGHQGLSFIKPEMLASLTTQYDYKFNRYSSIVSASHIDHFDEDFEEDSSEEGEEFDMDFDDDDLYSPIEIANLVCLAVPREKPAMVEIQSPRSPTFSSSVRNSLARSSMDSDTREKLSMAETQTTSRWSEEEEEEEDRFNQDTYRQDLYQKTFSAPTTIPLRGASSRLNSLKSLVRTPSLPKVNSSQESFPLQLERRDSTASSIHRKVTEPPREFNIGAFITSRPVSRVSTSTSIVVIPARGASKRHSRDLSTLTTPPVAPRNPLRNMRTSAVTY